METELNKDNSEIIPQQAGCSSTNKLVYSHFVIPLGYLQEDISKEKLKKSSLTDNNDKCSLNAQTLQSLSLINSTFMKYSLDTWEKKT